MIIFAKDQQPFNAHVYVIWFLDLNHVYSVFKINQSAALQMSQSDAPQPRALGAARVDVCLGQGDQSQIARLRQSGSSKLIFPRSRSKGLQAVLINTAGGITGGDRFELKANVGVGSTLTLTTQAAERVYRAQPNEIGRVHTHMKVGANAHLNWLPQELILFDKCAFKRRLRFELQQTSSLLAVESIAFGRAAMGEDLNNIWLEDRIAITRAGRPLYLDGISIKGDAKHHLSHPAIAHGAGAMASVICIKPNASQYLNAVRAILPETAGASLIAEDTLVVRQLAQDAYALRRTLVPVLETLSRNTLPAAWRL